MIRRARREDIPLLMELWQASFGDCMEYISFFFKNRFSPEKTFLYEESGRPVAMLFLLDASHIPPDIFMPPARRRRSVGVG